MFICKKKEGFSSSSLDKRYLLKRNDDILDDYYADMYETIHPPESYTEAQTTAIIQMTQPSHNSSVFLDVGSKTGALVDTLTDKGFKCYGVETSKAMVDYSTQKYPSISVSCGNPTDSMLFERSTFTHILVLNFSVYSFKDKVAFFRNCHHWLKSGGYMVVHLVDKPRFNSTIPASIPYNPFNWGMLSANVSTPMMKKPDDQRSLKTTADFGAFTYNSEYDIQPQSNDVIFREKFTDKETTNIREHEHTLYMEEMGDIVNDALFCNFIVQGKLSLSDINGGDPNQYLYVFERSS